MQRRFALIAAFGVALLIVARPAVPQNQAIRFLDAIPAKDGGVAYAVSPGSDLLLPFIVDKGGHLELYLSPFRGEHGDGVSIQPSIDQLPDSTLKNQRLAFSAVDGSILTLRLKTPALSTPGKYSGTLSVLRDGKLQQTDRLVISRALAQRPAKLTVDWKSHTVYGKTLNLDEATFNLQVRNTSAEWPADGIFLRLLDVTAPAGNNFDAGRHLKLTWNGHEADDLWRSPPAGSTGRSIAPNQQVEIGGQLRDLAPGEYFVKVGLGVANATVDNEQPITLKLFVKHGVISPLLVLLLAIAISYVATKGLEAQRRRGSQLKKVDQIRKGSWTEERDSIAAVAARAFLKQVEDRNRRWFDALFGQDTTSTHIGKAELLAKLLERVRRLRARIDTAPWRPMVRHRANKRLNAIMASINAEAMDENASKQIENDLGELEQWFDPKQIDALYMMAFKNDLDSLMAQATQEAFALHKDLVNKLRKEIEAGPKGGVLDEMERAYGALKVLWEHNKDGDNDTVDELCDLLEKNLNMTIEEFFRAADEKAWLKLESADFQFVAPAVNEVEPRHAYELIKFEIAPVKRQLGNNFLFKHKVTYLWSLEFEPKLSFWARRRNKQSQKYSLTQQITTEPRVVQYAPNAGTLYVTVELRHNGKPANKLVQLKLPIRKSNEYGWLSIFRFADMTGLGIATVFAVITGLATYYFGKHAFGSIADYIALFVWGAGVDQTKNFVQTLGQTSDKA